MTAKRGVGRLPGRLRRRLRRRQVDRWLQGHPDLPPLIEQVRAERLTYLSRGALADLAWAAVRADELGLAGELVEAGTALGGSAVVLARAKSRHRPMRVFDTFGLIPAPSERDGTDVHERFEEIRAGRSEGIEGDAYYGYRDDLVDEVRRTFGSHGVAVEEAHVALVAGVFDETLVPDGPVALAHIDADWYDSVTTCLERIHPVLVAGGRFVIDDYGSWSGAHDAVDDFLGSAAGACYRVERRSRLHLVRRSDR